MGATKLNKDGVAGKYKFDKDCSSSQLKGNRDEAPSCLRPDLNVHTCTADKHLRIRTLL